MNDRPCSRGQHLFGEVALDGRGLYCTRCPIRLRLDDLTIYAHRDRGRGALDEALRHAERDWYIKELES